MSRWFGLSTVLLIALCAALCSTGACDGLLRAGAGGTCLDPPCSGGHPTRGWWLNPRGRQAGVDLSWDLRHATTVTNQLVKEFLWMGGGQKPGASRRTWLSAAQSWLHLPKEQQRHGTTSGHGKPLKSHGIVGHVDLSSWFKPAKQVEETANSVEQRSATPHGNFEALDLTPWLADAVLPDELVPPDILPVWDPGTAHLEPGHEDIPKLYLPALKDALPTDGPGAWEEEDGTLPKRIAKAYSRWIATLRRRQNRQLIGRSLASTAETPMEAPSPEDPIPPDRGDPSSASAPAVGPENPPPHPPPPRPPGAVGNVDEGGEQEPFTPPPVENLSPPPLDPPPIMEPPSPSPPPPESPSSEPPPPEPPLSEPTPPETPLSGPPPLTPPDLIPPPPVDTGSVWEFLPPAPVMGETSPPQAMGPPAPSFWGGIGGGGGGGGGGSGGPLGQLLPGAPPSPDESPPPPPDESPPPPEEPPPPSPLTPPPPPPANPPPLSPPSPDEAAEAPAVADPAAYAPSPGMGVPAPPPPPVAVVDVTLPSPDVMDSPQPPPDAYSDVSPPGGPPNATIPPPPSPSTFFPGVNGDGSSAPFAPASPPPASPPPPYPNSDAANGLIPALGGATIASSLTSTTTGSTLVGNGLQTSPGSGTGTTPAVVGGDQSLAGVIPIISDPAEAKNILAKMSEKFPPSAAAAGTGEAAAAKADADTGQDAKNATAHEKNATEAGTAEGPNSAPPGSTGGANITSTTLEQLGFNRRPMEDQHCENHNSFDVYTTQTSPASLAGRRLLFQAPSTWLGRHLHQEDPEPASHEPAQGAPSKSGNGLCCCSVGDPYRKQAGGCCEACKLAASEYTHYMDSDLNPAVCCLAIAADRPTRDV